MAQLIRSIFLALSFALYWGFPAGAQPSPAHENLTAQEVQFAHTAWAYFIANEDAETGLVSSAHNFKSATLWDEGGYLLALISAYRLGIITRKNAAHRLGKVLNSLNRIPLYRGHLPNKVYNTSTLQMTNYANHPSENGIGWSALDIMRLVSGMLIATQEFPEHIRLAQQIMGRWSLNLLVQDGRFQGIAVHGKAQPTLVQEGRIGYEQYAGRIGLLVGLQVKLASQYSPILRIQKYFSIVLPGDIRTLKTHGVSSITTSEPFLLEALEFGWRDVSYPVAMAVYLAQVFRYQKTGLLTSLSEDHIKGKPYFAYHALLVDSKPFVSVTADRREISHKRSLSTKGSFGWWALMRDDYANTLLAAVTPLQSKHGWYAGVFEADNTINNVLSLNTNAVILEALHYKVYGPLYRP